MEQTNFANMLVDFAEKVKRLLDPEILSNFVLWDHLPILSDDPQPLVDIEYADISEENV